MNISLVTLPFAAQLLVLFSLQVAVVREVSLPGMRISKHIKFQLRNVSHSSLSVSPLLRLQDCWQKSGIVKVIQFILVLFSPLSGSVVSLDLLLRHCCRESYTTYTENLENNQISI